MASLHIASATGEGHAILTTAWVHVTDVDVKILAHGPKVRYIGSVAPFGVRYAGHFGLGAFDDGPDWTDDAISLVEWAIRNDYADYINPTVNNTLASAQAVYWRLPPGTEIQINVWWS